VKSVSLPSSWPLVARRVELERIIAALDDRVIVAAVIHGPAGVGKTRLAVECLAAARKAGRATGRATASERARSVPLGAVVHWLPPGRLDADPVGLFPAVAADARERGGGRPVVLLVDDLHLLDTTSAVLLGQLLDARLVTLIGTVRAGERAGPEVAGLWRTERTLRIDLGNLSRASVDTLLHLVLEGPVAAATVEDLYSASGGNVLFVRELVLGALAAGRLVSERGVWRLRGPIVATGRLVEVVKDRVDGLGPSARGLLDRIALWEPVGLAMVESVGSLHDIEELERAGLISVTTDLRRQHVTLAHPLHGQVIRDALPTLTRRRLLLEQAELIEARGRRRREDPVRVATARLDATGSADPELLLAAARLARYSYDYQQVKRLARAAMMEKANAEAGLLLGEALHELGAYQEAEEVLAASVTASAVDDRLVRLIAMRARNLMWGLQRADDALALNREFSRRVTSHERRAEMLADEAMLLTYSGQPLPALAAVEALDGVEDPRTRVIRAIAAESALLATGQCETAIRMSHTAFAEHLALGEHTALPGPGVHILFELSGLIEAGRLSKATRLAARAYDALQPGGPPAGPMWVTFGLGRCALLTGKLRTARRWFGEAAGRCHDANLLPVILSLLATAAGSMGDHEAARAAVTEMNTSQGSSFVAFDQVLGQAWAAVTAGEAETATKLLLDGARDAGEAGHRFTEAWLLHDAARLGHARRVAGRLTALSEVCEGALVPAWAAHARAAAEGRPNALVAMTDQFEKMGALLFAAEAAMEASHAHQRQAAPRAAAALRARAAALVEQCEDPRTPALVTADAVVPLTRREREIAELAARAVPSKEIARRLGLSVRTVNNHLQRVYTKLGVSSRIDLDEALSTVSGARPSG
jgi:DNA-binding CsgD family transcriptional regulator